MKRLATLFLLSFSIAAQAQSAQYAFRVKFKDKNTTTFSLDAPEAYLSAIAIDRREKFEIGIDSTDLPVVGAYINDVLTATGGILHNTSKWLNQCVILTEDSTSIIAVSELPFVQSVRKVAYYTSGLHERPSGGGTTGARPTAFDDEFYGSAWGQINMCNGEYLHEQGYIGTDVTIAVLDVGFPGVNTAAAFDSMRLGGRIKDAYNFIYNDEAIYESDAHGTKVLSTMAAYLPETYVGTAPLANYLLYATDQYSTEQLIEEDNWIAAAERADSAGADIINSSLGYNTFDNTEDSYAYEQLDGVTTLFAKAANAATRKGILVVTSAGNEGMTSWEHILTPGDADSALTVGSVNSLKEHAITSGNGPNAGGLLKPNVSVQGVAASTVTSTGSVVTGTGASYATPILSGMAACLMQAAPDKKPLEIRTVIEQVSDHYETPDNEIGFGVPDFMKALQTLSIATETGDKINGSVWPNPVLDKANLSLQNVAKGDYQFTITDVSGRILNSFSKNIRNENSVIEIDLSGYSSGLYFLNINQGQYQKSFKLVKL